MSLEIIWESLWEWFFINFLLINIHASKAILAITNTLNFDFFQV